MMSMMISPSWIQDRVSELAEQLDPKHDIIYGIPRGGVPVALALGAASGCRVYDSPGSATVFVDDVYDSGATIDRYLKEFPGRKALFLCDKRDPLFDGEWLVLPWEASTVDNDGSATDNIVRLLQYIGEDPHREGLKDTPARVLKAWREWTSGYGANPADVLKTFEDGAQSYDEMVVQRRIPVYSMCEHHMAPFFGTVTIGYIPNGRIVGLSKLYRLTDIFMRRLQVQERLTNQIADALMEHLDPKGVGVIIEARHMCMESRGVRVPDAPTMTSAMRGVLFTDQRARSEFLSLHN